MREEPLEDALRFPEKGASEEKMARQRTRLLERLEAGDRTRSKTRLLARWISAAAAAVLIAVTSYYFLTDRQEAIHAGVGEKLEKVLPDGSLIILNSGTRVSYRKDIAAGRTREVWISGEAFFRVAKTPLASPFTVHTPHFDVIVTGTQFNLNSERDRTGILLTEGSVTIVGKDGRRHVMKPGEYFSSGAGEPVETPERSVPDERQGRPEAVLSWLEKHLVFENTPMTEVAAEIERRYRIRVVVAPGKAGTRTVTGILPNDNLDVLLKTLQATTELRIQRLEDQIIIEEFK